MSDLTIDPLLSAVAGALALVLTNPLKFCGVSDDARLAIAGAVAPVAGIAVAVLDAPVLAGDALRGVVLSGMILGLAGAGALHVGVTYLASKASGDTPKA